MSYNPEEKKQKEKESKARDEVKKKLIDKGPVNKFLKNTADKLKEKKGPSKPDDTNRTRPGSKTKFPDLTGDGEVTQKDILKGRGVIKKKAGGKIKAKKMKKCRMDGIAIRGKTRAKQRSK